MKRRRRVYEKWLKRILDFSLAFIAIVCLSPVMLITAILVRINLGSPVIFKQPRPGKNEKIFHMYKFRTMTSETADNGEVLPDEKRITKFGMKLRSSSLDELPELFNILKGDMSIVGPRPLLVRYLERYNDEQRKRHQVRPGLTGLAQVNGRNAIAWEEKFKLDVEYIENITFLRDCKIILETVRAVMKHNGINSDTSYTMDEFRGSE